MKSVFGSSKKEQETSKSKSKSSTQDTSDRIYDRSKTIDEKIERLDAELSKCKQKLKKLQPGPAQETAKARAVKYLKQKKTYEAQREKLYSLSFNLDQVASATEDVKDAQQTHSEGHGSGKNGAGFMSNLFGISCLPQQKQ